MILLLALITHTVAHAHYPHDVAHWLAVSPDPSEPRWATSLERINMDLLGRSEDGLTWDARLVPGPGDGGGVKSGAFLSPQRLVLATPGFGLLSTEDAGDTWVREPTVTDNSISRVVASPTVLDDGLAFAAGDSALWRTADAGLSWEPVLEAMADGYTDLDVSPDFSADGRVCAVEGELLACSEDHGDSWTIGTAPADTFRISVGGGARLWAVVRGEGLFASSDMGESWLEAGFEGDDVTAVAELSGELLLLALAQEAAWRSTDLGDSWTQVEVVTIPFDQSSNGVNFFDFIEGPDGVIYLTNWFGIARSDDGGQSYRFLDTERIENTHSVTLTEGPDGVVRAWVGTYGGGPVLTDIHALRSVDFGALRGRFTRDTPVTTNLARDRLVIFDEGYDTFLSVDGGASWKAIDEVAHDQGVTLDNDVKGVAIAPNTSEDSFILLNVGQGSMVFMSSEDLGATWTVGSQDSPCLAPGLAAALSPRWPEESRAWASCHGAVYESVDRGQSWSVIGDTGAFVFELAAQPDGALLVASRDGLWRMHEGSTERIAFEGSMVSSVAASVEPGGRTVFALVAGDGWMRSDDGAETWTALPAPTDDFARMVSMSPHFDQDGTVAVAGYGGAWASTDRGDSWFSIHALEVYECDHDAWKTTGDWTTVSWPDASGTRAVTTRQAGASRTLSFEGIDLTLTAPPDAAQGVVSVSLDGGTAKRISLPVDDGRVWQVEGLSEGWHSLRIEAVSGLVTLDSLRVARIEGGDAGVTFEQGGCGCRAGRRSAGGAALLLAFALLLGRRRQARPPPSHHRHQHQPGQPPRPSRHAAAALAAPLGQHRPFVDRQC